VRRIHSAEPERSGRTFEETDVSENIVRRKMNRPNWDEYFMQMVQVVRMRSTCCRRSVGALIVRDNRLLSSGYNGAPKGLPHCDKVGCMRDQLNVPSGQKHELCRGLHAEQNAIIQAAIYGVSIAGGTMYMTTRPCSICTKMIINAEIHRIVYQEHYDDPLTDELLRQTEIRVVDFSKL
jgi:dCMP deaminase